MRSPRLAASQQKEKYIGVRPDVWSTQLPCALLIHKMRRIQGIRMHEKCQKEMNRRLLQTRRGDLMAQHLIYFQMLSIASWDKAVDLMWGGLEGRTQIRVSSKQAPTEQKSLKPEDNPFGKFCVCVHTCVREWCTLVCAHMEDRGWMECLPLTSLYLSTLSFWASLTKG